jgi:pimeloyl-ACP methyl ester carboxylesterase
VELATPSGPVYLELDWARAGCETVLLLHGMGSCAEDWLLQRVELRGRYHLLCLDLPGHGHSRRLAGWPSVASLAQTVREATLRWAPTRPLHLIGLSLGAAVSLQLLVDHPKLIRSAILVNGFGSGLLAGRGARHAVQRGVLIAGGRMDLLGERIAAGLFPRPEQAGFRALAARRIGANSWWSYLKLLTAIARFDLRPRLGAIACPVLLISGGRDDTVPRAASGQLARKIAHSKWVVLPNAKHAAPIDSAEAFNGYLLRFLAANRGVDRGGVTQTLREGAT